MDDDETRRVELPGEATPPAQAGTSAPAPVDPPLPPPGGGTADGPALPPPPPHPSRVVSPWPPATVAPSGLDVADILGRTFDTFGREWSLYLALAVPAGLSGFASAALTPSIQSMVRDPGAGTGMTQLSGIVAQLLIALISMTASLAMIVATDGFWRGTAVGLSDAVGRAAGSLPRAVGLFLLALLLGLGVGLAFVLLALLVLATGAFGVIVFALGMLALIPLAIWVSARLAVILPVLVLEDTPLLGIVGRTWRLTRGNALALFLTALVVGLGGLIPSWGGAMFSLFVDNRVIAGVALALASMVVAPLGAIWTVLAWGRLTGAPYRDSEVMAAGKGRLIGFALVAGVGMILVVVGGALAATGSAEFLRLTRN